MKKTLRYLFRLLLIISFPFILSGMFVFETSAGNDNEDVHSIAREWNELLLEAITNDFARPTVHARNLYHFSIVAYDARAAYTPNADTYFLGKSKHGFTVPFNGVPVPEDAQAAKEKAISFACYRLLSHRFSQTPGNPATLNSFSDFMQERGYDISYTSTNYTEGGPAALGNYLASQMINFGLQDGSNEASDYANTYYEAVNEPIEVEEPGTELTDPNRWQAITLSEALDQAGNPVASTPPHLSPEWGNVLAFALQDSQKTTYTDTNGNPYHVYLDPDDPPYIDTTEHIGLESFYKWGFSMVSVWQSHLDPNDTEMWDISPNAMGNIEDFPETFSEYKDFYDFFDGELPGDGYSINPHTNEPYEPQIVKRSDYARVIAEFWADGIDSETPPGHWFNIYNKVRDDSLFVNRWKGDGEELDMLDYDVKAYLALGGAMHDAAIAAWSIKGWYDYIRPVSALRYMAGKGQSSDSSLMSYHPAGIPLIEDYIELVETGDPLAGPDNENVGKIKLYTWKGPDHITDPETDVAGVGWILAENWWPYQRPEFVTPPFAGYVSGHSTFSRAAAEVLTEMTGDPFFPGGKSNWLFEKDNYLEFEQGPSEDIYLQYATYRDAANTSAVSRIWGGIHPPADDIPGRIIGEEVGLKAFQHADDIVLPSSPWVENLSVSHNLLNAASIDDTFTVEASFNQPMNTAGEPEIDFLIEDPADYTLSVLDAYWENNNTFRWIYRVDSADEILSDIHLQILSAENNEGRKQIPFVEDQPFIVNTKRPEVTAAIPNDSFINVAVTETQFAVGIALSEPCDTTQSPHIELLSTYDLSATMIYDKEGSHWVRADSFVAVFNVNNNQEEIYSIGIAIDSIADLAGNLQLPFEEEKFVDLNTISPELLDYSINKTTFNLMDVGADALEVTLAFNQPMMTSRLPELYFPAYDIADNILKLNNSNSYWKNDSTCVISYNMQNTGEAFYDVFVSLKTLKNVAGNAPVPEVLDTSLIIDTRRPEILDTEPSVEIVSKHTRDKGTLKLSITYSEPIDTNYLPDVILDMEHHDLFEYDPWQSSWKDEYTFSAGFNIGDDIVNYEYADLHVSNARDRAGNAQEPFKEPSFIAADTRKPIVHSFSSNTFEVTEHTGKLTFITVFDEAMDTNQSPNYYFTDDSKMNQLLEVDSPQTYWLNNATHKQTYNIVHQLANEPSVSLKINEARDVAGNIMEPEVYKDKFTLSIDALSFENKEKENKEFLAYPNPVSSGARLNFRDNGQIDLYSVKVFNTMGQIVFEEANISSGKSSGVDLPELPPGPYRIHIKNDNEIHINTIIIN